MELWPDTHDVEEDRLQLGPELGKGGQGRVLRVMGRSAPVVFKQYIVAGAEPGALKTLVELPGSLQPAERERLLRLSAWPLARVVRQGRLSGFVMQEIPGHFFAPNSIGTVRARELQYLLYPRKPAWGDIVPDEVGVAVRLAVATECAKLVSLLHSRSLVLGDLSMNNVLWAADPASVFLIDCDGIRRLGSHPVLPQAETPDWDDPQQPASGPDQDTDRYKLALLVGRVLCAAPYLRPGEELRLVPGVPDRIAVKVRELWTQAARPYGSRPEAWHWIRALNGPEEMAPAPPPVAKAQAERETQVQRPQLRQPKIFLCYRREDTQGFARGIYDNLAGKYGHEQVFRDIDSTPPGVRYSAWIESRVGQCGVMIVLIGDAWLSAKDRTGQRRLDLPKDWVRLEIETALRRDIPIIPVRLQGVPMPPEDELPPSIADLTSFQSAEVTDSRWAFDLGRLIQAIDNLIASD